MSLYIDGVTKIPPPIPAEQIRKQRELEQKQRVMERKIRKLKRLEAGTQDPQVVKEYGRKLKQAQQEMKAFVDEHRDVLKRDYEREKYYGSGVDKSGGSGIIKIERGMAAKSFNKASDYARKELKISIPSLSELPLETVNAVNSSIGKLYKDVPSLAGVIDEVLLDDMDEIAKSSLRWVDGSPQIRLKLARSYFANMSVGELENTISELADAGVFTPKKVFMALSSMKQFIWQSSNRLSNDIAVPRTILTNR